MYDHFYTTAMCRQKKAIEKRFRQIAKARRVKRCTAVLGSFIAMVILTTSVFASGILADSLTDKNLMIDGVGYEIKPILMENHRYLHTDSYYVPLRKTFEALGCTVLYDVGRENLPQQWQVNEHTMAFPQYNEWQREFVVDDVTNQIYGATTGPNSNMPIIEVLSKDGARNYYQVGCEMATKGWSPPVVVMDGTAYLSIRSLAYYLIPEGEDTSSSILWDELSRDTYYLGRLVWDELSQTVTIDTNAGAGLAQYTQTIRQLNPPELTFDNRDTMQNVVQRMENKGYTVCMVDNFLNQETQTCLAIEKATGNVAVLDSFGKTEAYRLRLEFKSESVFALNQIVVGSEELDQYGKWDLSQLQFVPIGEVK